MNSNPPLHRYPLLTVISSPRCLSPISSFFLSSSQSLHSPPPPIQPPSRAPLDFAVLQRLVQTVRVSKQPTLEVKIKCQYIRHGLHLVQSEHLRTTARFLPPLSSAEPCWDAYQTLVNDFLPNFDIRKSCGFNTSWIAEGCMNITTREEFEGKVSKSSLDGVVSACNQSLENRSPCASCTTSLSSLLASHLTGRSVGNVSDCTAYPSIYTAAFANHLGPTDRVSGSTSLVRFTIDEIREASKNFSRDNIIGMGGYGNVYKGVLPDGSEVALKRFKNCSVAGDASFAHEVEVIASVRHVNLVTLRGYCTTTTPLDGLQRIIVCDLMKNGSLHDHIFGLRERKLSWPIRQKIVLGTARGLAYLHYGLQPGIIHRDIKANNILLDDNLEPKVADFGLAKFTLEGMTHLSTRVAGTMGYVAPEYALYGQLTERSDVYSFGVVFLELLSGKKAMMMDKQGQPSLVTEWAWALVRKGRALDVIEDGMLDLGPPEVMEKYVLVAVLCSHPQLYARPTMDQVVKILEMDLPVPSIPDRPIPLIANIDDIERSVVNSSTVSGNLSSSAGYQAYSFGSDLISNPKECESSCSR
ncbi:receptor-like kinase in in flowers 3 [Actinidia rufa]|uniref:non-specific serine/threonine protein kinase n=1 Tax=Actinidia rufa TaxID=165716 RepID=A0A7J0H8X1_9ERIC|nr:receptor-like kinase in in flowers 3 [Actinidia rufa]